MRTFIIASACVAATACATNQRAATGSRPPGATESEWTAAADLATTLVRAAGADRLAPAMRVREHATVSRQHITLAAPGCYHVGIAWVSSVDLDASVSPEVGTPVRASAGHVISAPGGTVDFCTARAGGAWLSLREVTEGHAVPAPDVFEYAVVYGSGKPRRDALARAR